MFNEAWKTTQKSHILIVTAADNTRPLSVKKQIQKRFSVYWLTANLTLVNKNLMQVENNPLQSI